MVVHLAVIFGVKAAYIVVKGVIAAEKEIRENRKQRKLLNEKVIQQQRRLKTQNGQVKGEVLETLIVVDAIVVNGLLNGPGRIDFLDGGYYQGNFKDGYFHGPGYLETSTYRYVGNFLDGVYNGQGRLEIFTSGISQEGSFQNGLLWGEGRLTCTKSGITRYGTFKANKLVQGTLETRSGAKFVGTFVDDKITNGVAYYDKTTYEGSFVEFCPNGQGSLYYQAESPVEWYRGMFDMCKLQGSGTIRWKTGNEYAGEWFDGKMHGQGSMSFAKTGATISGTWTRGVYNGKMLYTTSSGKQIVQEYVSGKLIQPVSPCRCPANSS